MVGESGRKTLQIMMKVKRVENKNKSCRSQAINTLINSHLFALIILLLFSFAFQIELETKNFLFFTISLISCF